MITLPQIVVHAIGFRGDEVLPGLTDRFPGSAAITVPFEEKTIASPLETLRILRRSRADVILFGTRDLSLQRFQTVLKFLLLLAPANVVGLADLRGSYIPVTWTSFLTKDVPMFVLEVVMSLGVLLSSAMTLSMLRKNSRGSAR